MKRYVRLAMSAAGLWILDASVHAFLLSDGTLQSQILQPSRNELYSRCLVISALISAVALYLSNTSRKKQLARERDLLESAELRYLTVFRELDEGLAVREIICSEGGTAVDYRFVDVNPAFQVVTGLAKENVVGKTGHDLFPRLGEDLVQTFGRVALSGQTARFETYIQDLDRHFAYTVFSLPKGQFGTLMIDISDRKKTEAALRRTALFENCVAKVAQMLVSKEGEDLDDVLEMIASTLELDYCSVIRLWDQKTISRIKEWPDPSNMTSGFLRPGFEASWLGDWYETLRSGGRVLAGDLMESSDLNPHQERIVCEMGLRAFALVPIKYQDKLIGVLCVGCRQAREWSDEETTLMVTVSEIMATYHRRMQAERRMEYLTYHDGLTRVHNRAYFEDKLLSRVADEPSLSIIMGDLNGLKLINDTLGHAKGDRLIVAAAKALKAACRRQDTVVRWGGDEFLVILPGAEAQAAGELCDRIAGNCRSSEISISLGHATRTDAKLPVRDLIKKAEDHMYLNKLGDRRSARHALLSSLERSLLEASRETKEHCDRIKELSTLVGKALGMDQSGLDELALLASLHDVGKIGIPDHILLKQGVLTPDEWVTVKKHPEVGYRIARATSDLCLIADGVLSHHERWDGTGYPRGIAGNDIPLTARITAIADAFDAMTHERPYRAARSVEEALDELRRCSGSQFDPSLVPVFERVILTRKERGHRTGPTQVVANLQEQAAGPDGCSDK
ncbi:MAG: HD domain-containing phosphohydrolase [Bacillota bacterium]